MDKYISVKKLGAVGGDVNADSTAFLQAIQRATSQNCGICVESSPSGLPYLVSDIVSPEDVLWDFLGGQVTPSNVTIHGQVRGPYCKPLFVNFPESSAAGSTLKIRNADRDFEISRCQGKLHPHWFENNPDEWGHRANLCFQVGGAKTVASFLAGYYELNQTISLDETRYGSHLILEGDGFHTTHLQDNANSGTVLCDASASDECEVRDLKINEGQGARTDICLATGGTSFKCRDAWFGNSKYGIFTNKGTGTLIENCFTEACEYNRFIAPRYDAAASDGITNAPSVGGNTVSDLVEHANMYHAGFRGIDIQCTIGASQVNLLTFNQCRVKNTSEAGISVVATRSNRTDGIQFLGCNVFSTPRNFYFSESKANLTGNNIIDSANQFAVVSDNNSEVHASNNYFGERTGSQTQTFASQVNGGLVSELNNLEAT